MRVLDPRRLLVAFGLALAALLLVSSQSGGSGDEGFGRFEALYAEKIAAVAKAQARQVAADSAYRKMRHRRNERGASKAAILAERQAAALELEEAEKGLVDFEKKARLDGIPPGWFRERPAPRTDAPPASP